MKLIDNWRKAPKMNSVQAFAAIAALQGVWQASPELQAIMPQEYVQLVSAVLALLGIIGRLIAQPDTR